MHTLSANVGIIPTRYGLMRLPGKLGASLHCMEGVECPCRKKAKSAYSRRSGMTMQEFTVVEYR